MSNLKKCLSDETLIVPFKELTIDERLQFVEKPVEITDRDIKVLKNTRIPLVRVRWNSHRGPEYTWEREDQMTEKYPSYSKPMQPLLRLKLLLLNFGTKFQINGGMM